MLNFRLKCFRLQRSGQEWSVNGEMENPCPRRAVGDRREGRAPLAFDRCLFQRAHRSRSGGGPGRRPIWHPAAVGFPATAPSPGPAGISTGPAKCPPPPSSRRPSDHPGRPACSTHRSPATDGRGSAPPEPSAACPFGARHRNRAGARQFAGQLAPRGPCLDGGHAAAVSSAIFGARGLAPFGATFARAPKGRPPKCLAASGQAIYLLALFATKRQGRGG